jgi:hypothetical protein
MITEWSLDSIHRERGIHWASNTNKAKLTKEHRTLTFVPALLYTVALLKSTV